MSSEKLTQRIAFVDVVKAAAMVFVILGHLNFPEQFLHWVYSFHMALFFLVSGFLFNPERARSFVFLLKDSLRRYIAPYFVLGAILMLHYAIYVRIGGTAQISLSGQLMDLLCGRISVCWFLSCLFFVGIYYALLRRVFSRVWAVLIGLVAAVAAILFFNESIFPWCLNNALLALFFFAFGAWLREMPLVRMLPQWRRSGLIASGLGLGVLSWWLSTHVVCGSMREMNFSGATWLYPIVALIGIGAVAAVCALFKSNKVIRWISANTLTIFGLHMIFISWIKAAGRFVFNISYDYGDPWNCMVYNLVIVAGVLLLSVPAKFVLHRIFPNIFR